MDRVWCIVLLFAQIASLTNGLPPWPTPAPKTTTSTTEPPPSPEQIAMNNFCHLNCKTELCYLADTDCRKFIMCDRYGPGQYHASLELCAFGAYWEGDNEQTGMTCVHPSKSTCNVDYCSGASVGYKYSHIDDNCKTYWECTADPDTGFIMPKPSCCRSGYVFDGARCVVDHGLHKCRDACPLTIEAADCINHKRPTSHSNDGNCRTYWNCEKNHSLPVCCSMGQGYDVATGRCARNGCKDICPTQYQTDNCLKPGVQRYKLEGNNCRTYMQCRSGDYDLQSCCPSLQKFNIITQLCEPRTSADTCNNICPGGYKTACPLKRTIAGSQFFLQEGLDGTTSVMKCAPGSSFSEELCGCGLFVENAPDNSCNMELDILFEGTVMKRLGSQKDVEIMRQGLIETGEMLDKSYSFRFNGNLGFRLPYAQQSYDLVYVRMDFRPETPARRRQVLLSNCMNTKLGEPTFDLFLLKGHVILKVVTDSKRPPVVLRVSYTMNEWQKAIVIYDGRYLQLALEERGEHKHSETRLTGRIPVAAEGLDFGKCWVKPGAVESRKKEGFIGSMAKLQFSKCLLQDWLDNYYKSMKMKPKPMPTPAPTTTP